jgi:hypothetical protein
MKQYLVTRAPKRGRREAFSVLIVVFSAASKADAIRQFNASFAMPLSKDSFLKVEAQELTVGTGYYL